MVADRLLPPAKLLMALSGLIFFNRHVLKASQSYTRPILILKLCFWAFEREVPRSSSQESELRTRQGIACAENRSSVVSSKLIIR